MRGAIEKLYTLKPDQAETEQDTAVFRQQFIPQTLEQVYDFERDAEKVQAGEGSDLVYRDLLAGAKSSSKNIPDGEDDQGSDASGGVSVADSASDLEEVPHGEDPFAKKQPRGKRFEDKDSKREHKQRVKEEKRQQRANKMPKHLKKRLVSTSSRKKK